MIPEMLIHTSKGINTCKGKVKLDKFDIRSKNLLWCPIVWSVGREAKKRKEEKRENGESGTCLLPSNNVGENAKGHHSKHHGNEIDCLGKTHKKRLQLIQKH